MRYEKVVCIGLNKTGTSTIAECFSLLGYSVCPESVGYLSDDTMLANLHTTRFNAFEDYPWYLPAFYQKIYQEYPSTAFILTTRDIDAWFVSLKRWTGTNVNFPCRELYETLGITKTPIEKEQVKQGFLQHNSKARQFFVGKTNFAEMDWEAGDGWDKLCAFLDLPQPDYPFPHKLRFNKDTNNYER